MLRQYDEVDLTDDEEFNNITDETENEEIEEQYIQTSRPTATARSLIQRTTNSIDAAKRDLYEKIDVCCAQYGLHGLKIISEAVTQSLSDMINGYVQQPIKRPVHQESYQPARRMPSESVSMQTRMPRNKEEAEEMMTNSFMSNLGAIMENCDKYYEEEGEKRLKARLLEEKQYDYIKQAEKNIQPSNEQQTFDLDSHADDFSVVATEDLRENA